MMKNLLKNDQNSFLSYDKLVLLIEKNGKISNTSVDVFKHKLLKVVNIIIECEYSMCYIYYRMILHYNKIWFIPNSSL